MRHALVIGLSGLLALSAPAVIAAPATVGEVSFENSGAQAAQADFRRGLALLHNFEYASAATAFQAAQKADPGFAMAYWGEAMTHTHPVWMQQDLEKARAALAKLGASPKARADKAKTAREKDYLATVEILYGEGTKEARDLLFEAAMGKLAAKYPQDVDAAAFHALAILGTAHTGRDFATYMRAGAILEELYPANMGHPGVLHYLIHSYDDPIHAPLGLRAARRYGAVAPEAGHALHMTSHIFLALGMWGDVITANQQAVGVVNAQRAKAGKPAKYCGHYPSWLAYGYLQSGDVDKARALISQCQALAAKDLAARSNGAASCHSDPDSSDANSYYWMRGMLAAISGETAPLSPAQLANAGPFEQFQAYYGDLIAANLAGDKAALGAAAAKIAMLLPQMTAQLEKEGDLQAATPLLIKAAGHQAQGLVALQAGDQTGAIAHLKQAASLEESAPMEFGPPFLAKPSHELLGDALLTLKRPAEAAAAYRAALARAPGRVLSTKGLAAALKTPAP